LEDVVKAMVRGKLKALHANTKKAKINHLSFYLWEDEKEEKVKSKISGKEEIT
jgi:hypothetical protein